MTLNFGNNGPNTAQDFTRTVTLPAGLGTNVTVTGGNYNNATGAVAFTTPPTTLANAASANVTVTIPTVPATLSSITVATTIGTSNSQGSDTGDNSATSTVTVVPVSCGQPSYLDNTTSYNGLTAEYYVGDISNQTAAQIATFFSNTSPLRRTDGAVNFSTDGTTSGTFNAGSVSANGQQLTARYRGSVYLRAGTYTFETNSDDASYLWVGPAAQAATPVFPANYPSTTAGPVTISGATAASNSLFIGNGGGHGPRNSTGNFTAAADGLYDLQLLYSNGGGGGSVQLLYALGAGIAGGNAAFAVVPSSVLCAGPSAANAAPVATSTTNAVVQNGGGAVALSPGLSGADASPGSLVYYDIVTLPAAEQGVLALNGTAVTAGQGLTPAQAAALTFNPVVSFRGNASFTFSVTDNQGRTSSAAATYTIPVTGPNRFVTYSDNNSLAVNTSVNASVILNDDNPDASISFTATVVTQPTHGAVTLNADGGYVYTPNPNYVGKDSFTYQICQTNTVPACSNVSPVNLNIYDPNLVCISGTGPNLLINPSFASGNTGFVSGYNFVARPAAKVTASPNGLYPEGTYAVGNDANYYHGDFQGTGRTGAGDNFMIVNGDANIQRVYAQTVNVLPNRYYTFSVYANSVNPGSPAQLGFVINNESTSVVTTLDGTTNFVQLSDVWFSGTNTTATFEIRDVNRVKGGNDFGLDDVYFGTCSKTLLVDNITAPAISKGAAATTIPALTGTSTGGPTLASFTIQTLPDAASGVLALNGVAVKAGDLISLTNANKLTFNPTGGFTGAQAIFTYSATDNFGAGSDNIGTYIIPLDVPLLAIDDAITTAVGVPVTFNVTDNDRRGAANSPISPATVDLQPGTSGSQEKSVTVTGGTASVDNQGRVTFTPNPGFTGTALIPYTVKDNSGATSNQATLVVQVVSQLDLATTITSPATGGTVTAGQAVTIAGTTANNSPTGTGNVSAVQQLQLPANLTGTPTFTRNGASVAATYDKATGLVVFPALALAPSASATFGVTFAAPGTGPLTATASVNNGGSDVNLVNNVAAITLAITPQFDLATTLTGPASATAGTLATYTVVTANNGPSPATGAQQTVQLPINLAGVFATNGGTYDKGTGVVTFPALNLASGQAQTNSVSFSPSANFSPSAQVTPNTNGAGDPVIANNTAYLNGATSSTAVAVAAPATTDRANLYVTVTGPSQVAPAATAAYTVTQGNNGPSAAAGVQTQVSLPTGLGTSGFTVNNTAGTLSTDKTVITFGTNGTYTVATGLLVLPSLMGNQASGATPQSYAISLLAPAAGPSMAITASVRATTPDLVPANNVATAETEIRPLADLATTLSRVEGGTAATGPALTAGQLVTYAVQTVNNSANAAQNVLQTVALPAGIPVTSLQFNGLIGTLSNSVITFGNGTTYNVNSGLLTLPTLPTLAGNAVLTNTLSFAVPATSGSLQAVASISSPSADGTPANNTASVSNPVTGLQDLAIALSGPAQAVQGNSVFYTVTATNNGTSAIGTQTTTVQLIPNLLAAGFTVNGATGTLNNGVISFGTNGANGTYTVATGLLALPATAVGAPGTGTTTAVQFTVPTTTSAVNTVQLDIAAVVTGTNESDLLNNAAVLSTPTINSTLGNVNLATTITPSLSGPQSVGTTASYTVVTTNANANGTTAAQNVSQVLSLPSGLDPATLRVNNISGAYNANGLVTYSSPTGSVISYDPATGALVFPVVASLGRGASISNTVSFPLPVNGPVAVTATSSSNNPDPVLTNNTVSSAPIPVTSAATVAFGISGPATTTATNTVSYTLAATNNGPAPATDLGMTVTLPAGVTSYTLNGVAKTGSGTITIYGGAGTTVPAGQSVTNVIAFTAPAGTFTVNGAVSNSNSPTGAATATGSVTTTQANLAPVANDVANTKQGPQGNTGSGMLLSAISGTDADGSVSKYIITSLPTTGVLKLGGNDVALNQDITLANVANLTFTPASGFVGNAFFTYTATDNAGAVSAPATYTIPVAQDLSSVYTPTNPKGGATPYQNGDVLANVFDANSGAYNNATPQAVTDTGIRSATLTSGTLPGATLNPVTGVVTVTNRALLRTGSYPVTITTVDANGGTNTNTFTVIIGANPLPVELAAFTATAVGNRDAVLAWATASEKNNDHFDVERSLDGTAFVKIGQVKGQGSTSSATDYALTDANVAAKATGTVYYRLRQVDADGTASLSPVRSVSFTQVGPLAIGLYPNPAVASTQLDLSQLPAGTYQVSVVDMTGRSVLSASLAGAQLHTLDLAKLASGSYVVQVRGTATDGTAVSLTKRLVKE
ncbi:T9SS C-terminal target domain-containing protein [Hymenobacter nivis]|uniref:T9SS C-terminal target domain-containing protein n=1 Tax=Hymenobacter nivis TaxID=1850093 RepID=A0A502GVE3_9BACT|nr:T9SS C-terminal target domain-containing protein [Hymenobacter nivis]